MNAKKLFSGHDFPSGWNFKLQDFLRLRIVHEKSNTARLFTGPKFQMTLRVTGSTRNYKNITS